MLEFIKEETWEDVREDVARVNPELAKVIDEFGPSKEHTLFRAQYPFGSPIIENGLFHVPTSEGLLPITDSRVPKNIRDKLSYSGTIPMGVVLNRTPELILHSEHRMLPFMRMNPGRIFALWKVLDPPHSYATNQVWSMFAGARFIFMLPKITDVFGHKKLKRFYGVRSEPPRNLMDHWAIFKEIANHKNFPCAHHTEMLFFSDKWLERHEDNSGWLKFHNFLLRYAWNDTQYWRNKVVFDFVWDSFILHLTEENFRPNPHTIDIVKHLILIGIGTLPAFSPVNSDFINAIQDIYMNGYGLKNYIPTIMQLRHFSLNDDPVYYSFQLQTQFESSPRPRTINSIMGDMRDAQELLIRFLGSASQGKLKEFVDTIVYDFVFKVKYEFFHTEEDEDGAIRSVKEMPKEDKRLLEIPPKVKNGSKSFAETSPFFRGCVRISRIEK